MPDPLNSIDEWPAAHASAAIVDAEGVAATHGPTDRPFRLASVTKPLVALALLVAVEEGAVELDQPAGPPGSTVRHLLAHASGLAPDSDAVLAPPGARRIYSNRGFEVLASALESSTGIGLWAYVAEAVAAPLGMTGTELSGSAASGAAASVDDFSRLVAELMRPTLVSPETMGLATSVAFPSLPGVLPGFGRQSSNDWGLGLEIRDHKTPHWTGVTNSVRTFGHFGQTGTFFWVDPDVELGLVCLTDESFGPWALSAWPELSDLVRTQVSR